MNQSLATARLLRPSQRWVPKGASARPMCNNAARGAVRPPWRGRGEHGQATVEFALSLPLVVMLVLGIVQIAVVTRDRTAVELAAREGARAAAVSADPNTAAQLAVDEVTNLDRVDVSVSVSGDAVTVTVRTVNPTDVALIGPLIPDITITLPPWPSNHPTPELPSWPPVVPGGTSLEHGPPRPPHDGCVAGRCVRQVGDMVRASGPRLMVG